MNSENIKNITNQAIEQLIEALKAGKSEALTNYLAAVAKFHRYSFQNILLIARQCPQATRVAGFHAWRSLDRFVKKGEKGLMILAPLVRKIESADACSTEKESRIFGCRTDPKPAAPYSAATFCIPSIIALLEIGKSPRLLHRSISRFSLTPTSLGNKLQR